jgi:hypothetical protein
LDAYRSVSCVQWIPLHLRGSTFDFSIPYNTTGDGGTKFVIDSNGNVGIGRTGPAHSLHIVRSEDSANVELQLENTTPNADGSDFIMYHNSASPAAGDTIGDMIFKGNDSGGNITNYARIRPLINTTTNGSEAGELTFYTTRAGTETEGMRITNAGNVGIGTTSPGNLLTIQQTSATDPIADAWTTYSSRRWKTHITPITDGLDKVRRLQGVYFDWKADGTHDLGLIAEDVGQVVPEVVAYEENGVDAKSVDYARLSALLIEAVKAQQAQIEALQAEVEQLKAERQ